MCMAEVDGAVAAPHFLTGSPTVAERRELTTAGGVERDQVALVPVITPRSAEPKKPDAFFGEAYRNRRFSMRLRSLRRAEDTDDKTGDRVVGVGNSVSREIIGTRQCSDNHQDGIAGDRNRNRLRRSNGSLSILLTLRPRTLWSGSWTVVLIHHRQTDMTVGVISGRRTVAVQVITAGGPRRTSVASQKRQQAQR